jgi:hypothetical protein
MSVRESSEVELCSCKEQVELMLARSKTKVIAPTLTLGLLQAHLQTGQTEFSEGNMAECYLAAVRFMQNRLGHSLHIGARWEDAYSKRTLPKYHVVVPKGSGYQLATPFAQCAKALVSWIPSTISAYISLKLGVVPRLGEKKFRAQAANSLKSFVALIEQNIDKNPANFELICFAVLRVHLEKFACRIYRDTRTAAHDRGVDISTNFGVVYQIKKLRVFDRKTCDAITSELRHNFDQQRLDDGKVILVIDDIRKDFRDYLINMKVQSITRADLLNLAHRFDAPEDREKVLRIVHEEFRREYEGVIS